MALLAGGGLLTYTTAFINVFLADSSTRRKIADFVGTFLFFGNMYFQITMLVPLEKKFVQNHAEFAKDAAAFAQAKEQMLNAHLVAIVFSLAILTQQWISFASQKPKAAAEPAGKNSKKEL